MAAQSDTKGANIKNTTTQQIQWGGARTKNKALPTGAQGSRNISQPGHKSTGFCTLMDPFWPPSWRASVGGCWSKSNNRSDSRSEARYQWPALGWISALGPRRRAQRAAAKPPRTLRVNGLGHGLGRKDAFAETRPASFASLRAPSVNS